MPCQELLSCSVGILGDIEWELQCGDSLTNVDVKHMIVLDATIELLSVLANSINNFTDLGPLLFCVRPLEKLDVDIISMRDDSINIVQ